MLNAEEVGGGGCPIFRLLDLSDVSGERGISAKGPQWF